MVCNAAGNATDTSMMQSLRKLAPTARTAVWEKSSAASLLQLVKAQSPNRVSVAGSSTVVRAWQSLRK
jgi:hypothetical protein